jgi:transposase
MDKSILGVDISKRKFDVVLLHQGHSLHEVFANSHQGYGKLRHWLKKQAVRQLHACMEATGTYGDDLAEYLHGQGYDVSMVNPSRIKKYAESQLQRNKTDKSDAMVIADFCRTQPVDLWSPPEPALRELRELVRRLEDLHQMRTQEQNRLKAEPDNRAVTRILRKHITFLDQQIQEVEELIRQHIDQHPDLKHQKDLLTSIPGIGDTTASALLAEMGDMRSFEAARQLAAFAGVTPRQRQSGSSVRGRSPLVKIGNSHLRRILYFPALSARRCNPIIKPFCDNLALHHKPRMVVIGAAMRKLLHIAFGVLKSDMPFDPHFIPQKACLTS